VLIELFGHGRSPAPDTLDCYHPDYYVQCFEEIRQIIGAEQWLLMGYSLGAGLTLRYSLQHPDRVIAQMFTNSTSAFADPDISARYRDKADETIRRFQQQGMPAVDEIAVHPRNAKRLPADLHAALLEDCQRLNPAAVARTMVHTNGHASVRDQLHEINRPTLLLCGQHEQRFLPLRDLASDKIPALEISHLNAGHAVNAEDIEGFNQAAISFIRRYTK
ncbi:MAG: alpha/beta hydrolase, partial [Pseudomonadales bacterium]|nr:alpha/beta hydrolase [Pseudomonadales bacterium]